MITLPTEKAAAEADEFFQQLFGIARQKLCRRSGGVNPEQFQRLLTLKAHIPEKCVQIDDDRPGHLPGIYRPAAGDVDPENFHLRRSSAP